MNYYIIYKLLFPNGKVYIGQTFQDFVQYMNRYNSISKNKKSPEYNRLIYRTIRKYNWNKVKKEIICTVSEEFVDEAERYFIKLYKSNNKLFGYNLTDGGNKNKHHSEETKEKLRKINLNKKRPEFSGKNHPFYNKKRPEHSKFMSIKMSGKDNPNYGKKYPKQSKRMSGKNNPMFGKVGNQHPRSKPINMYDKNYNNLIKTYESITQASINSNVLRPNIIKVLNGERKFAGGFGWRYV